MKKRKFSEDVQNFFLKIWSFLSEKFSPLGKKYNNCASSKYGRLIRMNSYFIYALLFLPTWCAIWIADHSNDILNRILLCILFAIGSFLTRSIGCIINDIADIKFDRQVERTKSRPLASGEVTVSQAISLVLIMSLLALIILLSLPQRVLYIGGIAAIMMILYPFSKRYFNVPQLVLGFTFNLGVLIGWLSVTDTYFFSMIVLYVGFSMFTVAYDTIYACQDLQDDEVAGVKSFPLFLQSQGRNIKSVVWNLYKFSMSCIAIVGLSMGLNSSFFLALAIGIYLIYNYLDICDISKPDSCAENFRKSLVFLFILFLGTVFGK